MTNTEILLVQNSWKKLTGHRW